MGKTLIHAERRRDVKMEDWTHTMTLTGFSPRLYKSA